MVESDNLVQPFFLQPGELFTAREPARVKTVLGSCVAITMRDLKMGMAAMAHCLLPIAGDAGPRLPKAEALRYVDTTIELMLQDFAAHGTRRGHLEVKLFGGADGLGHGNAGYRVGSRNVEVARAILELNGLNPVASDVGGKRGRVIEFNTQTGEVLVKRLPSPGRGRKAS